MLNFYKNCINICLKHQLLPIKTIYPCHFSQLVSVTQHLDVGKAFQSLHIQSKSPIKIVPLGIDFNNKLSILCHQNIKLSKHDDSSFHLNIPDEEDVETVVHLPRITNLSITSSCGPITLENLDMNSRTIVLSTKGQVHLNNIKSSNVTVDAGTGISSKKVLLANVKLKTDKGPIHLDRLQGGSLNLSLNEGDIQIQSVYSENFVIEAQSAQVNLGSFHGDGSINIDEEGMIAIGSAEGNLSVCMRHGSTQIHMEGQCQLEVDVAEGDIDLSTGPQFSSLLDLTASQVQLDPKLSLDNTDVTEMPTNQRYLGSLNNGQQSMCRVQTREGVVRFNLKSWLQSLKLGQ